MGDRLFRRKTLNVKKAVAEGRFFSCQAKGDMTDEAVCIVRQTRKPRHCRGCARIGRTA